MMDGAIGAAASFDIEEIFYRSVDDLTLYVRAYRVRDRVPGRPLLCLSGLTRNHRDFDSVAESLVSHETHPRDVYCFDYRGRGRSDWDKNWQNYSPLVELTDILQFVTLRDFQDVAILGTSRGGIITMLMAVMRPSVIGCAVLNDIGPVIETAGLARIMGYAGKIPVPRSWDEARDLVREINKRQFPLIDDAGWDKLARQFFNDENGRPAASYDPAIGRALSEVDIAKPIPDMWAHFDALKAAPLMVIRGENSDLLSAATVQEMKARAPSLTTVTIQNEGHAPLLNDKFSQRLIADFLALNDATFTPGKLPPPSPEYREIITV